MMIKTWSSLHTKEASNKRMQVYALQLKWRKHDRWKKKAQSVKLFYWNDRLNIIPHSYTPGTNTNGAFVINAQLSSLFVFEKCVFIHWEVHEWSLQQVTRRSYTRRKVTHAGPVSFPDGAVQIEYFISPSVSMPRGISSTLGIIRVT